MSEFVWHSLCAAPAISMAQAESELLDAYSERCLFVKTQQAPRTSG
jgi:hypothetical protein